MIPENAHLLVSKALAKEGRITQAEALQLAEYARTMREATSKLLAAFLAAESYTQRGRPRAQCMDALFAADDAIEEWAESIYGSDWRSMESVLLPLYGEQESVA